MFAQLAQDFRGEASPSEFSNEALLDLIKKDYNPRALNSKVLKALGLKDTPNPKKIDDNFTEKYLRYV